MVDLNKASNPTGASDENSWHRYQELVLAELERLNKQLDTLDTKFDDARLETTRQLATLQVKAGVWGLVGASIPAAIVIIYGLMQAPR